MEISTLNHDLDIAPIISRNESIPSQAVHPLALHSTARSTQARPIMRRETPQREPVPSREDAECICGARTHARTHVQSGSMPARMRSMRVAAASLSLRASERTMLGFVFSVTVSQSLRTPSRLRPLNPAAVGTATLLAKRSRARQVVRACVSDTGSFQRTTKLQRQLAWFAERATIPLLSMVVTTPALAEAAETSESTLKSLFKSLPLSLVHPIVMDGVLLTMFYVFYLGLRARTLRTTSDKELKLNIARSKPGERHYQLASILLAVMTVTTFEGMANTYTRTGKLFPGPHLYIGLSTVALMSIMASLAPAMRQGSTTARNIHFTLAFAVAGGFLWQLQSGFEIVLKLLGWK